MISAPISIIAAAVPLPPAGLQNVASVTNASQIGLLWTAATSNGSPVIDYRVSFD